MTRKPGITAQGEAKRVLQKISIDPPINVDAATTELGIEVVYTRAEGGESSFTVHDDKYKIIGINNRLPRPRQRFSLAHQIGHYLLHVDRKARPLVVCKALRNPPRSDVTSLPDQGEDIEANAFATELLMPSEGFAERFFDLRSDVRENTIKALVDVYEVPTDHVTARAIGLGLILS